MNGQYRVDIRMDSVCICVGLGLGVRLGEGDFIVPTLGA